MFPLPFVFPKPVRSLSALTVIREIMGFLPALQARITLLLFRQ